MVIVFFSMLISPSQRSPRGMLRRFVTPFVDFAVEIEGGSGGDLEDM
jgi:hypothetical protein